MPSLAACRNAVSSRQQSCRYCCMDVSLGRKKKKQLEKKLDGNYTRMLTAILNKSWRQHATRHQLYRHLPPITKTIQVRRTRDAGHCWRSRDEQKQDDQLEHTYSSYGRIRDVALKTCLRRWTIGKSGKRGSGISVLAARHDDDDDDGDGSSSSQLRQTHPELPNCVTHF